jgi:hypothetical protein
MTDSDDFLTRWSRRKREAKAEESSSRAQDTTGKSAQPAPDRPANSDNSPAKEAEPAFDLSKLPSLDSIGPDTDMRMFMQPGVPAALSRAAFRRAWSADPAIRDFIGLSENSWDFTKPDSIEGFGPLVPTDNVKRMLAQLFNEEPVQSSAPSADRDAGQSESLSADAENTPALTEGPAEKRPAETVPNEREAISRPVSRSADDGLLRCEKDDDATQQGRDAAASFGPPLRRRHGGALPT